MGAGHWGPNLIRNLSNNRRSRVVACAEVAEQRREAIRARYPGIRVTGASREVLDDPQIDAIVVATPTSTHYGLAKDALVHRKHVFVEKPLATESSQCEELIRLAREVNRVLFVGHVFVYNAGIQAVKRYIDGGELGRIYYLQITRTNLGPVRDDVSALWDLAPHDVAIFNYLLASTPEWVSAVGAKVLGNCREDVGFRAMIHEGNTVIPRIKLNEPLLDECEGFLEAIADPGSSLSSGQHGKAVVDVLVATDESIKQNGAQVQIGDSDA